MKKLNVCLSFYDEEGVQIQPCRITVPKNITKEDVEKALVETKQWLEGSEEGADLIGTKGRTPETLLDCVCEKKNWSWEDFPFDLDMEFSD